MFTNRPTLIELLEAVHLHLGLEDECQSDYKNRVATNLLKIVKRELQLTSKYSDQDQLRLKNLLQDKTVNDDQDLNAVLCEAIRTRQMTYGDSELMNHLFNTTMAKLSIDNPNYSSYLKRVNESEG